MSLTLLSLAVLAGLIVLSLLLSRPATQSLAVLERLAARDGGKTAGRYLLPRLLFPVDGGKAQLSHQWSRRAAVGISLVFRDKFLVFKLSAEPLRRCPDVIVYTRIGWTGIVRQVGYEPYRTGHAAFDERFVVFVRRADDQIAELLREELRRQLLTLKEATPVLEVLKVEGIFRIKYQKSHLNDEHEAERILRRFLDVYRAFVDPPLSGRGDR